jgi:hypothetical protein
MASEPYEADMGMEGHKLQIMAGPHHDSEGHANDQPQCANDNVSRIDSFHSFGPQVGL